MITVILLPINCERKNSKYKLHVFFPSRLSEHANLAIVPSKCGIYQRTYGHDDDRWYTINTTMIHSTNPKNT